MKTPRTYPQPKRFFHALRRQGQSSIELALLLPTLFILFFSCVQLVVYIQSSAAAQYGAFVAARAFQVYGDQKLGDIGYTKTGTSPHTNPRQSIAEAAAEMVIFESLMWEQTRIHLNSTTDVLNRTYEDGNDLTYSDTPSAGTGGAVRVGLMCQGRNCDTGEGVVVRYCAPFILPGAAILWSQAQEAYPCRLQHKGETHHAIAIDAKVYKTRESTIQ